MDSFTFHSFFVRYGELKKSRRDIQASSGSNRYHHFLNNHICWYHSAIFSFGSSNMLNPVRNDFSCSRAIDHAIPQVFFYHRPIPQVSFPQ
jgi:hypothetical protein